MVENIENFGRFLRLRVATSVVYLTLFVLHYEEIYLNQLQILWNIKYLDHIFIGYLKLKKK